VDAVHAANHHATDLRLAAAFATAPAPSVRRDFNVTKGLSALLLAASSLEGWWRHRVKARAEF
jgi:hypothetical protein